MELKKYLSEQKQIIDRAIEDYFSKTDNYEPRLKEAMLYSLRAGGKRLRPVLVMASAEACGGAALRQAQGAAEAVMPIALALEMIHTFSLIHDDLPSMDDDDLRRGLPTSHIKFGEATAILAGDALLTEAFACLSVGFKSPHSPLFQRGAGGDLDVILDIANATGAAGMTGGQQMDLDAEDKKISYDELVGIHRRKTGALITVSVTSGAKAVTSDEAKIKALKKYGEAIGLAFQITDDILDIEGTTEALGKPAKSDLENKKSTYPAILGMEKSKKLAKEMVDNAYSALAELDAKADPLREIARYIMNRKS